MLVWEVATKRALWAKALLEADMGWSPGVPWSPAWRQEAPTLAGSGYLPGHQKPGLFWDQSPRGPSSVSRLVHIPLCLHLRNDRAHASLRPSGPAVLGRDLSGALRAAWGPHGCDTEEQAGTGWGGEPSEACGGFLERGLKAEQGTRRGVGTEVSQLVGTTGSCRAGVLARP